MNAIFQFYNSEIWHPGIILLAFWLFWPGSFFLVGLIGESRIIPIGRGQSVMFFPGDLTLGVIATALIGIAANSAELPWGWPKTFRWLVICLILSVSIFIAMRIQFDAPNYSPRSAYSPTKIWHDLVGYGFFPFFGVWFGFPQLMNLVVGNVSSVAAWHWVVILLASFSFIYCAAIDLTTDYSIGGIDPLELRHPCDWLPIWRTGHIQNYNS